MEKIKIKLDLIITVSESLNEDQRALMAFEVEQKLNALHSMKIEEKKINLRFHFDGNSLLTIPDYVPAP